MTRAAWPAEAPPALADGVVVPSRAIVEPVRTPDQRPLVAFSGPWLDSSRTDERPHAGIARRAGGLRVTKPTGTLDAAGRESVTALRSER